MRTIFAMVVGTFIGAGATGVAWWSSNLTNDHSKANQPYADQHGRTISSLSNSDVEQLLAGQGWGLAKPAEFNDYPGPAHVLEFADELVLEKRQFDAVKASFDTMKLKAQKLGVALVDAEAALDEAFKSKTVDEETLNERLTQAESLRAQLRAVHLKAHLEVTPILSDKQKLRYAELRGYENSHSGHSGH